jgi:hypothetical protein
MLSLLRIYIYILKGKFIAGVCIKSMGPDLVLRFDPLYKNQYPTTEHYSVQLLRKGENYKLGKHNLPPFIPASQLLEKYISNLFVDYFMFNCSLKSYQWVHLCTQKSH